MVPFPAAIVAQLVDEFRRFGLGEVVAIWDVLVSPRIATTDCIRKGKIQGRAQSCTSEQPALVPA